MVNIAEIVKVNLKIMTCNLLNIHCTYNIFVHVHKNLLNLLEDGKGSLVMLKPGKT